MIGAQIQRARKARAWSLRALGDAVGVSQTMIKKYEDGVVTPSSTMLLALARALEVRVEYFLRPQSRPLEGVAYRKRQALPKKRLEALTAVILDQVERRLELESFFPDPATPAFQRPNQLPPRITTMVDVERAAEVVRASWQLGTDPIQGMVDLFERHGVRVFVIPTGPGDGFDGSAATVDGMPVVVVGEHWPGERQRFTLAHELGHQILNGSLDPSLDEEAACNRFASAFLLPRSSLVAILGAQRHRLEDREVDLVRREFGLSMSAVIRRARDVGIIPPPYYQTQMRRYGRLGWRVREPGIALPSERAYRVEHLVFRALAESHIGESKAAELLNLDLGAFRSIRALEAAGAPAHQ